MPSTLTPRILKRVEHGHSRLDVLERQVDSLREAIGRIEARQVSAALPGLVADGGLAAAEFRVFSQWNEDGIIHALLELVDAGAESFVEIGTETYHEANTRFLLLQRNWRGLVIDGGPENARRIASSRLARRHDLTAVDAFVTRDDIDELLVEHGFEGRVGLFSLDIDGVDWWIWEALSAIRPAVVVAEYNWRFGPHAAVTVPYQPVVEVLSCAMVSIAASRAARATTSWAANHTGSTRSSCTETCRVVSSRR